MSANTDKMEDILLRQSDSMSQLLCDHVLRYLYNYSQCSWSSKICHQNGRSQSNQNQQFRRSKSSKFRLERQYRAWQVNIGYFLHPNIEKHDRMRIADVGTGTALVLGLYSSLKMLPRIFRKGEWLTAYTGYGYEIFQKPFQRPVSSIGSTYSILCSRVERQYQRTSHFTSTIF